MAYPKKTWGDYEWDDSLSDDANIAAAKLAKALIEKEDVQRWEDWLFTLDARKPASADISDATDIGKSLLKAATVAAARTAIGAGTSNLAIGTTSTTALKGDYKPAWADVTDKPTIPPAYTLPAATASALGGVKKAATQADSTATDIEGLVADFNALLAKLKTAGIMA